MFRVQVREQHGLVMEFIEYQGVNAEIILHVR